MSLTKNNKFARSEYDRDHHDWEIGCDDHLSSACDKEIGIQHSTFSEVIAEIKLRDWQIYKDGETWKHRCPICKEEKKLQAMERMKDEGRG